MSFPLLGNKGKEDLYLTFQDGAGLGNVQVMCKDARAVAAGGAVEMEIARHLCEHARGLTGLEQYSFNKFAEALEVRPRPLPALRLTLLCRSKPGSASHVVV